MPKVIINGDIKFGAGISYFPKNHRIDIDLLPELLEKASYDMHDARLSAESSERSINKIMYSQEKCLNKINDFKAILNDIRYESVELVFQHKVASKNLNILESKEDEEDYLEIFHHISSVNLMKDDIHNLYEEYFDICIKFFISKLAETSFKKDIEERNNEWEYLQDLQSNYLNKKSYCKELEKDLSFNTIEVIESTAYSLVNSGLEEALKTKLDILDIECTADVVALRKILCLPISSMLNQVKEPLQKTELKLLGELEKYEKLQEMLYAHKEMISKAMFAFYRAQDDLNLLHQFIKSVEQNKKESENFEEEMSLSLPQTPVVNNTQSSMEGYLTDEDKREDVIYPPEEHDYWSPWLQKSLLTVRCSPDSVERPVYKSNFKRFSGLCPRINAVEDNVSGIATPDDASVNSVDFGDSMSAPSVLGKRSADCIEGQIYDVFDFDSVLFDEGSPAIDLSGEFRGME